ncbi:hypothetical protein ACFW9N_33030 [Streptomyces sp. NPDC059496]|uniref:hypothetical protein n=1 Tax=Streptomyces sp. NPDC059496 TaxID=3346851 RepID=UPI0036AEFCCD
MGDEVQERADQEVDGRGLRSRPRVVEAADGWEEAFTPGPPGAPVVVLPADVSALARGPRVATVAVLAVPVLSFAMEMQREGQLVLRAHEHEADILSVSGRYRAGLTAMPAPEACSSWPSRSTRHSS